MSPLPPFRYPPMLRRAALTALVAGSMRTVINHGPALLGGNFPSVRIWQFVLNYTLPFSVAIWGARTTSRNCDAKDVGRVRRGARPYDRAESYE
jgi:hypothetical protein